MRSPRQLAVVVFVLAGLLVATAPAISHATVVAPVSISLDVDTAHPGDPVTVKGYDGGPTGDGDCVLRVFDGDLELDAGAACSAAKNDILGSFDVPKDLKPTTLTITVCVSSCLTGGSDTTRPASAKLVIENPVVEVQPNIDVKPDTAQPGQELTIVGAGPPSETGLDCSLELSGTTGPALGIADVAGKCSISSSGSITGSFTAPAELGPGSIKVTVFCDSACSDATGSDDWSASDLFVIRPNPAEPQISLSPNPAQQGNVVTISGTGPESAAEQGCVLTVTPDDTGTALSDDVGSCSINEAGVIGGSFAVPADLDPATVTVSACVASCLDVDDPGPAATASLVIQTAPVRTASIFISPNQAKPLEVVTISGSGPKSADARDCAVDFNGSNVDASCSIDAAGAITGSLTVPANTQPGAGTVTVCEVDCSVDDEIWRASAALEILLAAPLTPTPTPVPDEGVLIPDLTTLNLLDAEETLKAVDLRIQVTGDRSGAVSGQVPAPGVRVLPGTVVLVTFTQDAEPNVLALLVVLAVIVIAGGTALTIRHRTQRPREQRGVKNPRFVVEQHLPRYHAQPVNPDDSDAEIKVVVSALHETVDVLEVQR